MKHIKLAVIRGKKKLTSFVPTCGAALDVADEMVEAALHSDCDACRVAVKVSRVNDQVYGGGKAGVRQYPVYDPQPMVDAGNSRVAQKRRSGK